MNRLELHVKYVVIFVFIYQYMYNNSYLGYNHFAIAHKQLKQDVFVKHKCPPIMTNSIDCQDHKDKYFDTSKKILSQEMTMCNMETLISYFYHVSCVSRGQYRKVPSSPKNTRTPEGGGVS